MTHRDLYNSALYLLLNKYRFFGEILLRTEVVLNEPKAKTAFATITRRGPKIAFSPKFIDDVCYKTEYMAAVLVHEIYHLILDHCDPTYSKNQSLFVPKYANLAMDAMINQEIRDIPPGMFTLEVLQKLLKARLEPKQSWLYYYKAIMDNQSENIKKCLDDAMTCDGVPVGDGNNVPVPGGDDDIIIGRMKLGDAINKARAQAAGNMPHDILQMLEAASGNSLPWESLLQNLITSVMTTKGTATWSRINRRYPMEAKGKKRIKEANVSIAVDESGSMSDDDVMVAIREVIGIIGNSGKVTLIQADAEVHKVTDITGDLDLKYTRVCNGGTMYGPALEKAAELESDVVIYIGDMDSADTPQDPGIPVIWVTTSPGKTPPANFGQLVEAGR